MSSFTLSFMCQVMTGQKIIYAHGHVCGFLLIDGAGGQCFGSISPERTQLLPSGFLYPFRIDEAL